MSAHVSDELLERFVDGDLEEPLAVPIAVHIDACSACATRAAALDPLNAVFASAPIADPPEDLASRVIEASQRVERTPLVEIAVGAGLMGLAGALALATDGPWALMADLGGAVAALLALARGVGVVMASFQVIVAVTTVLALAGVVLTLHFSALAPGARERRSGRPPPRGAPR